MNILVVSDSHFLEKELVELVTYYRDKVDMIVHCGDSQLTDDHSVWNYVDYVVKGNCDFSRSYKNEVVFPVGEVLCYMTHGDSDDVNYGLIELADKASDRGAKIAFYGHTHRLNAEKVAGVVCINPGSLKEPRGNVRYKTFAIVKIEELEVTINFYDNDHNHIHGLEKNFKI